MIISFQSQAQTERDTVFYEIKPDMIVQTRIVEDEVQVDKYRVLVRLKKEYHSKFEQLTEENIDNFLGVKQDGEILSPSFPVIKAKIPGGRFLLLFDSKEEARKVVNQIKGEDE
ncbi:SecDF P1 head subdomain-containing protein [Fodinibius sp. Rm-B-1B1-1]|uniref:SecDF P1 head subdomain-containing protein n=1 Tax=Fodinibius alkaliphilus TaxID=3140241 RepID=UPI00315AC977